MDRINAKNLAKLLDSKSLTLGFRFKQIWPVFLCDAAKWGLYWLFAETSRLDRRVMRRRFPERHLGANGGPIGHRRAFTWTDRNPAEYKLRWGQVTKWADHTTREGPAGITKREWVRAVKVTRQDELIGGPSAKGKIGDFLIENDQLRAVVAGPAK